MAFPFERSKGWKVCAKCGNKFHDYHRSRRFCSTRCGHLKTESERNVLAIERIIKHAKNENGCRVWKRYIHPTGYGMFSVLKNGKYDCVKVHRWLWEYIHGKKIEKGFCLDHLCRNRPCINLDHLELVTISENTCRGDCPSALNRRKKVCQRGHLFDIKRETGYRECSKCKKIQWQNWYARNKPSEKQGYFARRRLLCLDNRTLEPMVTH